MKKLKFFIIICLTLFLIPIGINFYVINISKNKIKKVENLNSNYNIALVLGCSAFKNGTPSKMLQDRLDTAIYLYRNNLVKKILISGDHQKDYSEITAMNNYLKENGIDSKDILIDDIGYSTGESLINYKNSYKEESVVIVTQKYHLYRAMFIAEDLGLNAVGAQAKSVNYKWDILNETREFLARNKDFVLFKFWK